jgi:hypothetical protein
MILYIRARRHGRRELPVPALARGRPQSEIAQARHDQAHSDVVQLVAALETEDASMIAAAHAAACRILRAAELRAVVVMF